MSTPKISVIVPVYNVEQYLPRCIDSISAQAFTDFELQHTNLLPFYFNIPLGIYYIL